MTKRGAFWLNLIMGQMQPDHDGAPLSPKFDGLNRGIGCIEDSETPQFILNQQTHWTPITFGCIYSESTIFFFDDSKSRTTINLYGLYCQMRTYCFLKLLGIL
jgi:hypothetical protein